MEHARRYHRDGIERHFSQHLTQADIKALTRPVLSHRLVLTPEAEMSGATTDQVLADVLASVPVPSGRPG